MSNQKSRIVVKLGGTEGVDFTAVCKDVVELLQQDHQIVLVHGGSAEANALGEAVNYPARFVTSASGFSSRYREDGTRYR